jgi:hypothetical protein
LKPNDSPEEYSQRKIRIDLDKNIIQSPSNQLEIQAKNPQIIDEKNIKKIEEIAPKNNIETNEIITKKELIKEVNDGEIKDLEIDFKAPQHPYSAPRYSDFYSPVYNPYHLIGNPSSYYLMHTFGVQDPVIEHPH